MVTTTSAIDPSPEGIAIASQPAAQTVRGGANPPSSVQGASAMTPRCESLTALAIGRGPAIDLEGKPLEHLRRVGGPEAPRPIAQLRISDRDLAICDGAGLALYTLRMTATTASWEQRTISYPPAPELRAILEHPDWARWARRLCLTSAQARVCRVPVGVVAAEARAVEEIGGLDKGEEALLWLSEATSALLQSSGKVTAKAGRLLKADIERGRRPSHVPLYRLQGALAEELALGRSVAAICSRSPRFTSATERGKLSSLLCRRLGLQGTRDAAGHLRYARVAQADTAELLCEVLDVAPEQVGL